MDLGAAAFYVVATATIIAALGVVVTRSIVYSALLLILSLALTGLIYLLLLSDFLALVQILVYGGTVSILLMFALMLTRVRDTMVMNHRGWPIAAVGAVLALVVIGAGFFTTDWSRLPLGTATRSTTAAAATAGGSRTTGTTSVATAGSLTTTAPQRVGPEQLASALFTTWAVPFEIASVVLLVALVGSLLIARATDQADAEADGGPEPGMMASEA